MNAKTRRKFLKLGIYNKIVGIEQDVPSNLPEEKIKVETKIEVATEPAVVEETTELVVLEEVKPKLKKNKKIVDNQD